MAYMHKETFEILEYVDGLDKLNCNDYFQVDEFMALPIQVLNRKGYTTTFCCSGHVFENMGVARYDGDKKRFYPEGSGFASYISFKPGISLPTLPFGYVIRDSSEIADEDYPDLSPERLKSFKETLAIDRYYVDTRDFAMIRDIVEAMEHLYEWALSLPDFTANESKKEIAQDYQANYWYRKAAEQGNSYAQYWLGFCYDIGRGVKQDYTQAVYWYTKAAEQGDASAQCNLGYCYEHGEGVGQDYIQAVYWYRKSAEQNDAVAQHNLGECYRDGKGVEQDYEQATYWYTKSAEQGYNDSEKALESMKAHQR